MFWSFAKGSVISVLGMFGYVANLINMIILVLYCLSEVTDNSCRRAATIIQTYLACQAVKLCILVATVSMIVYVQKSKFEIHLIGFRTVKNKVQNQYSKER
jgi:hypothetical protein